MGWREAARLADVAYAEVALQATYAFRQGNPVPARDGRELAVRARHRIAQSKALIGVLLSILALGAAALLAAGPALQADLVPVPLAGGLFRTGVLSGLFGLELALLWWTGIQAIPTFVSSLAIAVLEPLPVDRPTLRQTAFLLFLRLFDVPVAVVLVLTPLGVGLALGPVAGLATVPGAFAVVGFALALALVTGRSFVRRVQGSRGGGGGTIVRWAYLIAWLLPAFGLLAFVTVSPPLFRGLATLPSAPFATAAVVVAAFPFCLASWPTLAAGGPSSLGLMPGLADVAVLAGGAFVALAGMATVWLFGATVTAGRVPGARPAPGPRGSQQLRPQWPAWAVLTKDLRLASRTPGYAFLILLPILDAVALGFTTYAAAPSAPLARGVALGAVSSGALLATFFGPAFFALEVVAQSYGRTLPLAPRAMAVGKVTLVAAIYLAAGGIVLGLAALRFGDVALFGAFVLAELPAVVAAGLLELGILFWWSRRRGLPVTTLYASSWNIALVALPGIAVALVPLATFLALGLVGMALAALAELGLIAPYALGRGAP